MTTLPRPNVEVVSGEGSGEKKVDVIISQPQGPGNSAKARSYQGTGATGDAATKSVIEKILNDPRTAEDIPRG